MTLRSLVYVANARLPTEKAHGHAIVKLCEAFAALGLDVELWHPHRHQADPRLRGRDIFEFYGVKPVFGVRTLPNLDVVRLDPLLPALVFRPLFVAHEAAWGLYVARLAAARPADLYVTRDLLVARALARKGLSTVLDVHVVPRGPRRRVLWSLGSGRLPVRFVALTEGSREELVAAGVPAGRIAVAGSGVDLERFADLPDRETCRRQRGLPPDRPIVGYVGRFETLGQDKGISTLVRAVGLLATRMSPRPFLLCVGGPMDRVPEYLALAAEVGLSEGDARFVDHVPAAEVPGWIRALDVGVALYPVTEHMMKFASPLKLYEYMAAGIAVVASDLPTMREALRDYPASFFVSPDDVGEVAATLEEALPSRPEEKATGYWRLPTWSDRARAVIEGVGAQC